MIKILIRLGLSNEYQHGEALDGVIFAFKWVGQIGHHLILPIIDIFHASMSPPSSSGGDCNCPVESVREGGHVWTFVILRSLVNHYFIKYQVLVFRLFF